LQNLNVEAKQAIEQTVKQTEGAMDNYFNLLQQTMSAIPWGNTDFGEKLKSFTEQNIAAAHDLIQKLSQARDFQDIIKIQTYLPPAGCCWVAPSRGRLVNGR
jgi:hypothetical protein